MSEQVKRWPMWRAIEELGPDDWVVRDTCCDTLAQRCRGLEAKCERTEQARAGWEENATLLEQERDSLLDEIADLEARLLEAERGNEELVRLRAEQRNLHDLMAETCTAYDEAIHWEDLRQALKRIKSALEAAHD